MKIQLFISLFVSVCISVLISAGAQANTPKTAPQNIQSAPADTTYTQEEIAEARELMLTVPELRQFPQGLKAKRRASIILSEYIELKDNQYKVAVSEDEAAALGVSPEFYKECVAEIETTNKMIAEQMKEGIKVDLPDIQAIMKAYKRGELSLPIVM